MLTDFKTMSTQNLQEEIENNTILIDIRREDEWQRYGIIESSYTLTFFDGYGNYDLENWMNSFTKIVKDKNQKFVLICAHAHRTKTVCAYLARELQYKNVYELDGGINYGWIDKGLQTIQENK